MFQQSDPCHCFSRCFNRTRAAVAVLYSLRAADHKSWRDEAQRGFALQRCFLVLRFSDGESSELGVPEHVQTIGQGNSTMIAPLTQQRPRQQVSHRKRLRDARCTRSPQATVAVTQFEEPFALQRLPVLATRRLFRPGG